MPITRRSIFLAALAALGLATIAHAGDFDAMQGRWTVVSAEAGGQPIENEDLKAIVVTIKGSGYEVVHKDKKDAGTLTLDETQKPKTMDATKTEGAEAGQVVKAIYEISGDTMRVCYAANGTERPTELKTSADKPWLLLTYQREK